MSKEPRDIYFPAESWKAIVSTVSPKPQGMDPGFAKAQEPFERYSTTIGGEIGEAIRRCQEHLTQFLNAAHEIVSAESGENPSRLGRPRPFPYGEENLTFQIFNYKDLDTVSIREDRFADLLTYYDRFRDTMRFMETKVEEGNLGVLKNSFVFIHKPLQQSAEIFERSLGKSALFHTTEIGIKADPNYVHIVGTEPCLGVEPGCVCRVLKPGYAYEGREIQEGVVMVAQ